ncbi:hypothetical protein MRS76_11590 [Rhizobiaceae bacterium n13]|uniref:DUF3426 domain-containing protein n=1 Tax=Ferirhizobium litorale TaxID=2927786 RepID=A0AAE3U398_9HYPH|nr:hypothetical protein [Fererhizobium litorale]MDI7862604.1 hypothetical protein [Fererhizobium litorale]MDI7923562.1 hypothetical protein [Fererhizobium litorale]
MRYDLIPPEPHPGRGRGNRFARSFEIVDADFVVIRESRPRARQTAYPDKLQKDRRAVLLGVVARRLGMALVMAAERVLRRLPARRFAGLVASLSLLVFVLAGGYSAVARGSRVEAPAVKSLEITSVNLTRQDANGMPVLLVNAVIENRSDAVKPLAPIRADLVSGGRLLARTIIAAPASSLAAGESRGIATRLPYPGGKLPEVRLSFTDVDVSIR